LINAADRSHPDNDSLYRQHVFDARIKLQTLVNSPVQSTQVHFSTQRNARSPARRFSTTTTKLIEAAERTQPGIDSSIGNTCSTHGSSFKSLSTILCSQLKCTFYITRRSARSVSLCDYHDQVDQCCRTHSSRQRLSLLATRIRRTYQASDHPQLTRAIDSLVFGDSLSSSKRETSREARRRETREKRREKMTETAFSLIKLSFRLSLIARDEATSDTRASTRERQHETTRREKTHKV
jgi:hypothetical protein